MGRKNSAFTLVELIIVLAIIAILAVIALAFYRSQILKGNDARRKADLDRIKIAVEEYEKDHNCYPSQDLLYCNVPPLNGMGLRPYLDKIPCDPVTHASYNYEVPGDICNLWYRLYTNVDLNDQSAMALCGPAVDPTAFNYYSGSANAPGCTPAVFENTPSPSTSPGGTGQYGCKNGVCVEVQWDPARPGWECGPTYQNSSCYGASTCRDDNGMPINPCIPWNQK